ncbi:MAG: hypothetical protein DKT66_23215 [Candidatus Melainabacteria bacterium]|nr:MAG: hypothetical protein DKT66_23215 [Candidatus Melainabacteria bacterium]
MKKELASEKQSKFSPDEVASNEANSASDALFEEFSRGAKELFRGGLQLTERVHDGSAAFFSAFLGEKAAENHTRNLEKQAAEALKHGNTEAAKHFLKRDLSFTGWTQSQDDEDTVRLQKELKAVELVERQRGKEKSAEQKAAHSHKSNEMSVHLAKLMITGA